MVPKFPLCQYHGAVDGKSEPLVTLNFNDALHIFGKDT